MSLFQRLRDQMAMISCLVDRNGRGRERLLLLDFLGLVLVIFAIMCRGPIYEESISVIADYTSI